MMRLPLYAGEDKHPHHGQGNSASSVQPTDARRRDIVMICSKTGMPMLKGNYGLELGAPKGLRFGTDPSQIAKDRKCGVPGADSRVLFDWA